MASDLHAAYEFGQFTLIPSQKRLINDREVVSLAPKVFDTLVLLVENRGRLIPKEEFLKALWSNSVVEEQALAHNISQLRKVLRDPAEDPRFIETVPKRGYRFIASVRALDKPLAVIASPVPDGAVPSTTQPLRWSRWTALAVLVLAASATLFVYFRRTGREAAGVVPAIHSLAVLPFQNLSGDKEQEYFADGMTDALTTDLAQISSLRVISRTSAMQFKGSKETLPQIGRDLQVEAVVEGTVTRGANRMRVTAQLVEANGDRHLWARSYERDLKDALALQDEIAQDVVEQVRGTLTPRERSLLVRARTVDSEAYDAYLRGLYWLHVFTPEGYRKGCDYSREAIAKDPGYAPAYVAIVECEPWPDKRATAKKALELDPSLAEAHSWLGNIKFGIDRDWAGAEAEYNQAIALNPNSALAHDDYSRYLVAMGRLDEAMRESEFARDVDPYSALIADWLGQVLYHARRYDDALRENRRGLEMQPDNPRLYWEIADIYEQKKMFAEAFAARQQALSLYKEPRVAELDAAYKDSGYVGYLLKQAEFERGKNPIAGNPIYAAHIYALLNDEPRAMAVLEAAYNEQNISVLYIRTAPELDSIRSSPRFRDLVRRIGFPPSSDHNN